MFDFNPLSIISQITSKVVSNVNIQNNKSSFSQFSANLGNGFSNFTGFKPPEYSSGEQLYFKPAPLILTPGESLKLTTIAIDKKAQYIRSLLNLPDSFQDFKNELTFSTAMKNFQNLVASEGTIERLFQNNKIDIFGLSMLLKENSKEAVQKLLMLISNVSKYGANDISGLKEIMTLLNSQAAFATSDNQVLKTLILLYLPWLPLAAAADNNLDFTIDIFDKIKGPDPDKEEQTETVKILIKTNNYANIIAILEMNSSGQVDIDVTSGSMEFPHKRVIQLIKEDSSLNNIISNVSSSSSKTVNKEVKTAEGAENGNIEADYNGEVKIVSSNAISPKLMIMAHSLIKIIIQLDYEKSIIKENDDDNKEDENKG